MLLLCGGSSIKHFNNGIDESQCLNMGITNFWSVEATHNLYICKHMNYFKNMHTHKVCTVYKSISTHVQLCSSTSYESLAYKWFFKKIICSYMYTINHITTMKLHTYTVCSITCMLLLEAIYIY